jgi:isopenicillin N synthase-like dioxygenase
VSIPVVDISRPDAPARIAEACERFGFLSIIGHGVDAEMLDRAWTDARAFFDQSLDVKMRVAMPSPGYPYGYSPMMGETLSRSLGNQSRPDRKQSLAIGPVDPPTHTFADADEEFAWSPNLWPEVPSSLRESWSARYRAMSELAARLLSLMAHSLDLPPDWFDSMIDRHTSAMRALDYPGRDSVPTDADDLGASAHTDYGTLTVLEVDAQQAGLEVQGLDGTWLPVMPPPGALVVNLGDAMARWTNDRWRSTMHRVVVPEHRRQSIAFFHNANWDAIIECLEPCRGEGAKYAPIGAGPHLMHKFRSTVNTY